MSQEVNSLQANMTFGWLEFQPSSSQSLKYLGQILKMLRECLSDNYDVRPDSLSTEDQLGPYPSNAGRWLEHYRVKGITFNSNRPSGVQNAVFSLSFSSSSTCARTISHSCSCFSMRLDTSPLLRLVPEVAQVIQTPILQWFFPY